MLSKIKQKKALIFGSVAALVIVIGVVGVLFALNATKTQPPQYTGPTPEEQTAGNDAKQKIVDEQQNQSTSAPATSANVTISYASFSNGIADINAATDYYADGQCTVTLTHGSLTVKKTVTAYKDVSSTICTNPKVPRSEFKESGEWSVVVAYTNTDGNVTGTSSAMTISIP